MVIKEETEEKKILDKEIITGGSAALCSFIVHTARVGKLINGCHNMVEFNNIV